MFETFKSLGEVFHEDGSAPTAGFGDFDTAANNACRVAPRYGDVVLAPRTAWGDIGQAGAGELLGPLVAQNGRYIRVQTLYNQAAYDFLVRNRILPQEQPAPCASRGPVPAMRSRSARRWSRPPGSTWRDSRTAQRRRFYTRTAIERDPTSGKCSNVTVGLVGLHIATKTPSRPQWTWSTYEQADLVPPARRMDRVSSSSTTAPIGRCPRKIPSRFVPSRHSRLARSMS